MTRHTRTAGAPVEGFARMYRLVPSDVEDAFEAARAKLARLGYDVLDQDWWQQPSSNGIFVAVWGRRAGWEPKPSKAAGVAQASA